MNTKPRYKVLFINPPSEHIVKMEMSENVIEEMGHYLPLGLLYIATYLREKSRFAIDVGIVDCVAEKFNYDDLRRVVIQWNPDMCGITTFTPTIVDVLLTCRLIKELNPQIKTILGGHHVDSYPRESLSMSEVDLICQGEAEESMLKLVERIIEGRDFKDIAGLGYKQNGNPVIDGRFPYISDLDSLPLPDRNLIQNDLYNCTLGTKRKVATISSSRGCPYQCTFCYCPTKNYRIRSVDSIVLELKDIAKRGIAEVFFFDDLFNFSSKRVIDISRAILDAGLRINWSFRGRVNEICEDMLAIAKRAGCERIHYGIETSSDDRLRRLKKNITVDMINNAVRMTHKYKITTVGSFMIGLPEETKKEILQTFAFMKRLKLDYAQISVLMPYPNTELYRSGLSRGVIKYDFWKAFAENPIESYHAFQPQLWTELISREELFKLVNVGYRQFYIRFCYILKSLIKIRSVKELLSKVHGGWILLKEILSPSFNKGTKCKN